jgi:hypothetical protein
MARTTLMGLSRSMKRRSENLPKKVSEVAKKVSLVVVDDLTQKTPVDTSKALSNWQTKIGSPVSTAIPPYIAGMQGSTQEQSAQAVISITKSVLAGKTPGKTIYISNVLEYISRLNDGHSAQEPAGFVERAAMIGRNEVKKARLNL